MMAILSCEPEDVAVAQRKADEMYQEYRSSTKCLNCPHNSSHAYKIMGGHIIASYCHELGEWLEPDEYRSTIEEMGCEP